MWTGTRATGGLQQTAGAGLACALACYCSVTHPALVHCLQTLTARSSQPLPILPRCPRTAGPWTGRPGFMPCVLTRGAGVGSASVLSVGEAAGSRAPAVRGSARQVGLGSQPLRSHAVAAQAGGGLGAAAVATGMQTPGMQVVDPMNGGGDHAQDKEKLYQLVAELSREETRETALLELSKKRETFPDLAPILWHSFGTTATLLQEIVCIYPLLSPPQLTGGLLSHTRFFPRPPLPSGPFLLSACAFACCPAAIRVYACALGVNVHA